MLNKKTGAEPDIHNLDTFPIVREQDDKAHLSHQRPDPRLHECRSSGRFHYNSNGVTQPGRLLA